MRLRTNLERVAARKKRVSISDPTHLAIKDWVDRATVDAGYVYGTCPLTDRLADGDTYFVVDPMGRLHHPLSTVPKGRRHHVRVDGHGDLVAVDVGACQPALAGLEARADLRRHSAPWDGPLEIDGAIEAWLADCRAGSLYERLMERVEADTGQRLGRQLVKQRLLAVMYGHPDHTRTAVGLAMDGRYPGLRGEFGRRNGTTRGAFARALQRRESGIMIAGAAAAAFVDAYPGEVCVTIHDCLLVREHMAAAAVEVVRQAWRGEGFDPAVKQERWAAA